MRGHEEKWKWLPNQTQMLKPSGSVSSITHKPRPVWLHMNRFYAEILLCGKMHDNKITVASNRIQIINKTMFSPHKRQLRQLIEEFEHPDICYLALNTAEAHGNAIS